MNSLQQALNNLSEADAKQILLDVILNDYTLVQWPKVQGLMDEEWFDTEAFLANPINQEQDWVGSSAYFIPVKRTISELLL